jgi:hypothetical protein
MMGALLGGGGRAAPPPVPEIKPPTVMPDPDKEALDREEFRKLSAARRRTSTRANTIIGDGETLG